MGYKLMFNGLTLKYILRSIGNTLNGVKCYFINVLVLRHEMHFYSLLDVVLQLGVILSVLLGEDYTIHTATFCLENDAEGNEMEPILRWRKLTAIIFSFIPPTGRTFPIRDTSPVIAIFCLIGLSIARDKRAVTIVTPALGPSLGVAPSGTCKWMWLQNGI